MHSDPIFGKHFLNCEQMRVRVGMHRELTRMSRWTRIPFSGIRVHLREFAVGNSLGMNPAACNLTPKKYFPASRNARLTAFQELRNLAAVYAQDSTRTDLSF